MTATALASTTVVQGVWEMNEPVRGYALDRAAAELRDKLAGTGIEIPYGQRMIMYDNTVIPVDPFTTHKECMKILRKLIKTARQKQFNDTQGKLL